jgi:Arc/MetJ-type ribon-helix-helix transcriptional regulator
MRRNLNVSLTERHQAFLDREIAEGRAVNAADVVRQALEQRLQARELHEATLTRLRAEVEFGYDQLQRGEFVELDDHGILELFEVEFAEARGT